MKPIAWSHSPIIGKHKLGYAIAYRANPAKPILLVVSDDDPEAIQSVARERWGDRGALVLVMPGAAAEFELTGRVEDAGVMRVKGMPHPIVLAPHDRDYLEMAHGRRLDISGMPERRTVQ